MFFSKFSGKYDDNLTIFSAPICGFTRFPFRQILKNTPLDLIYTEMVSIDALFYHNPHTLPLLRFEEASVSTGAQVFGSKPDLFIFAADKLFQMGFSTLDINCGCPVKKVIKSEAGSFLLTNPEKIYQIISQLKNRFPDKAISAKIRLGYNHENQNYLEIARAIEESKADWLTVHGRTRPQMYEGEINYEAIQAIKARCSLPVIGNGNIFTPEDAKKMWELTGCDAIMLARGLLGNPWLPSQIRDFMRSGHYHHPTITDKLEMLKTNLRLELDFDPRGGFREFKKIGVKYLKNIPGASSLRKTLMSAPTQNEMLAELALLERELNSSS